MIRYAGTVCVLALFLVAGCGERTEVTVYKQGHYQGKPDKQPWDNDNFKGNRDDWEQKIKKRTESQNEYARVTPSAN